MHGNEKRFLPSETNQNFMYQFMQKIEAKDEKSNLKIKKEQMKKKSNQIKGKTDQLKQTTL